MIMPVCTDSEIRELMGTPYTGHAVYRGEAGERREYYRVMLNRLHLALVWCISPTVV